MGKTPSAGAPKPYWDEGITVVGKKGVGELAMDANLVVVVLDLGKGGLGRANRIAREEAAGEKFSVTESKL